jgi:hypothetical protein
MSHRTRIHKFYFCVIATAGYLSVKISHTTRIFAKSFPAMVVVLGIVAGVTFCKALRPQTQTTKIYGLLK